MRARICRAVERLPLLDVPPLVIPITLLAPMALNWTAFFRLG